MSTVSPTALPALVSDLGVGVMMEGYDTVPRVVPSIFEVVPISPSAPPEGFSEAVITGGKKPKEMLRGADAPATTLEQSYQWYGKVRKYGERIEITEEVYNAPNAQAVITGMLRQSMRGWGEGWAQAKEELGAAVFNKGVLSAGHLATFDGSYPGRVDPYPKFIYDGKPFFAASGNGHPLGLLTSTTKYNLIVSAALSSSTLETARVLIEDTNAVDEVGDKVSIRPDTLIVPPGLEQTALVLLDSQLKPGTANNDINTHAASFAPITWRYLTDTDGWFLGKRMMGLRFYDSGDVMRIETSAPDPASGSITVRAVGYAGVVVTNWRGWVANNLATS